MFRIIINTALLFLLLSTTLATGLFAQGNQDEVQYEGIEWTNVWIPSADKNDLPRVLLIGNSITQGYYNMVENSLHGKAYVAHYTTSRGIVDPVFFTEIKNIIKHHKFEVIHFNNGLHGCDYTSIQYETGLKELITVLEKHGRGAELNGAPSTRVLHGFTGWKTDEFNQRLIETRNKILVKICLEENIEVDDLYEVTKDHTKWFSDDKIHYNEDGYKELSKQVVDFLLKKIETR